jgi:signal transduction histidine kinase
MLPAMISAGPFVGLQSLALFLPSCSGAAGGFAVAGMRDGASALTAAAYLSIAIALVVFWRRRARVSSHAIIAIVALVMLAGGLVHVLAVWKTGPAQAWVAEWLPAFTAATALAAAGLIGWLLPKLASRRSPAELEQLNEELERRVARRTGQLTAAHAALAASEDTFRAFMDNSPLDSWIIDAEGVYRYVSRPYDEHLKFPGGLQGRKLEDVFPAAMAAQYLAQNRRVLDSGVAVEVEQTAPDGDYQVHLFPLRGTDHRTLVGGLAINVTGRRRAHAALQQQSELLAAVTAALRIYLENGDWKAAHGLLLRCALKQTGSECGLIGVTVDGARLRILAHEGIEWEGHLDPAYHERIRKDRADHGYLEFSCVDHLFGRVATTGEVLIDNAPPRSAGGAQLKSVLGLPVRYEKQVVGLIAVADRPGGYDETFRARLETLINQTGVLCDSYRRNQREAALGEQVRVSQKMEAVGLLAGGVAHDFNNLLQVIQGYTAMAQDAATSPADRRASLAQVREATERAAQLTHQLLAFGRQQTLQKTDIDLNKAIADLLRMLHRVLGEQIKVDFIPGHDLGNVCADRGQIDQVLLNLCLNARDALAGADSGRITIETENVLVNGTFRESHPWAKPGRYVLTTVTDNGAGMDRETVSRIFEPFFTTKGKDKGTGLGLAVVYGVIKQHDGMAHVYSEPGKGTTFKIYLPIVERSASSVGPKHTPAHPRGTETVLLAEDESMVRELALRILKRSGYRVLVATNGVEACALAAEHADKLALLILDVVMPDLGGPAAYKKISAQRAGLPVIFCSGYAGSALDHDLLNARDVHVLAKPYGADELLAAIRRALD